MRALGLRVGERVRVRPLEAILETLDENGCLDALPFMPEMARRCDQEFTVLKRVDKVNDLVDRSGLRRMTDAVILDGEHCDGAGHGGCQARCQSIWKEAWLDRAAAPAAAIVPPQRAAPAEAEPGGLQRHTRVPGSEPVRFRCQQTELKRASTPLAWWDPRQYVRDWRSGNASAGQLLRALALWLFSVFVSRVGGYRVLVGAYDRLQRWRGGSPYPYRNGRLRTTPLERLQLHPGEWVQVKSLDEIIATLDTNNKNRGLWFDVEMVRYCGGRFPVLARVERIIEPKTGKMLEFASDLIILDGVTTLGDLHRFYPQNEYQFWREIWLRRCPPRQAASSPVQSACTREVRR